MNPGNSAPAKPFPSFALRTRWIPFLRAGLIVVAASWVFAPAIGGGWVWDDFTEIAHNAAVQDARGLPGIWTAAAGPDYFPLKTTVQWAEWRAWGDWRAGYHLVSLGLHLLSAILFWRLLRKLGAPGAWLGGLLFAIHPMTVESVAWIAELKNTLSLPPLLLAMLAWVDFDREKRRGDWALALGWFLVAMLCKTSVVMFPMVLLLYAWWRRGRIGRSDLAASAPFFAVSLGLGLVTVWFQAHRAAAGADLGIGGPLRRLAGAGMAAAFYAWKSLFPAGLMPIYPRWAVVPSAPLTFLPWLALAALAGWFWRYRSGWGRHALLGYGFFLLNLAPVLGFIPMAYLRISWVADHFAYIALLGWIGVAAAGAGALAARPAFAKPAMRTALWGAGAAVVALLAVESRRYASIYADDPTYWASVLRLNPGSWMAHNDLGMALAGGGRLPEAIGHYEAALRLNPDYAEARNNLGNALAASGRLPEAVAQYDAAIRLEPNFVPAQMNRSGTLVRMGLTRAAVDGYRRVVALKPDYAEAHYCLANLLGNSGKVPEAMEQYREALRFQPAYPEAHANLGLALVEEGRAAEAVAEIGEALRLRPRYAEAHAYLGYALAAAGRPERAIAEYGEALRLEPGDPDVHYQLALALRAVGRTAEAAEQMAEASRLKGPR